MKNCPYCNCVLEDNATHCPHCFAELPHNEKHEEPKQEEHKVDETRSSKRKLRS